MARSAATIAHPAVTDLPTFIRQFHAWRNSLEGESCAREVLFHFGRPGTAGPSNLCGSRTTVVRCDVGVQTSGVDRESFGFHAYRISGSSVARLKLRLHQSAQRRTRCASDFRRRHHNHALLGRDMESIAPAGQHLGTHPLPPSSGATIFVYYGNPSPSIPPAVQDSINNPGTVFNLFDDFAASQVNAAKWSVWSFLGTGASITLSNGILTLSGASGINGGGLTSTGTFGPGYLLETSARHPDANGSQATAAELGFGQALSNSIRLLDYSSPTNFQHNTTRNGSGGSLFPALSRPLDASRFLMHRIYWVSASEVRFAMESDGWQSLTANVPTAPLPVFLLALAYPDPTRLMVDWVRIRKFSGTEPAVVVGAQQLSPGGTPSVATSTVDAAPVSIVANGTSTSAVTVQMKDAFGTNLTQSGGTVALFTTARHTERSDRQQQWLVHSHVDVRNSCRGSHNPRNAQRRCVS